MLRIIFLFAIIGPLCWGQEQNDLYKNAVEHEYGGVVTGSVTFAFQAYDRGHTCSNSIKPLYRFVESNDSTNQVSASVFSCDQDVLTINSQSGFVNAGTIDNHTIVGKARNNLLADGKAMADVRTTAQFDETGHQVILDAMDANLMAATYGRVGTTISYIVWVADEANDTTFDEDEVLWEASATISDGILSTEGGFSSSDFTIISGQDSIEMFFSNVTKTVQVPANVNLKDVIVQVDGRLFLHEEAEQYSEPMGLTSEGQEMKISVYPNPAKDFITMEFEKNGSATVELIDIKGSLLRKQEIGAFERATRLDLAGLEAGTYFLRAVNSRSVSVKKIIVR